MRRFTRRSLAIGLAFFSAVAMQQTVFAAGDKEPVIGIVAIDLQNSFFLRMEKAGNEAAADYHVKTIWQGSEGSLEKEISIIENFVNQGVDAILIDPLDRNGVKAAIAKAKAKNIPVIAMGNKVDGDGNYNTLYPDYKNVGVVARALATKLGGKGQIALLIGSKGNYVSDTREQGFRDTIKKEFPGIQLVGVEPTNWDGSRSANAMQTWLATYPNLKGVACISDSMCLAAKAIADASGRQIAFAGYDGDEEMSPYINDGSTVIDVLTGAYRVGYWNVAVAARLAKGEKLPQDLYMPTYFIMSAKTAQELKAKGLSVPSITPDQAKAQAVGYRAQMGPSLADSALTTSASK
jgi:ribose transport system substrate-binding protein